MGLEYKVNDLMKLLFEHEGIADPAKAKLKNPEKYEDMGYYPINEDEECCWRDKSLNNIVNLKIIILA